MREGLMSERVSIRIDDGIADVRLNRPDKLNALDPAMMHALAEAGDEVAATPGVRAVVLSGEGRAFSAGLDFASFAALAGMDGGEGEAAEDGDLLGPVDGSPANFAQRAALVWQEIEIPVIAAIHGFAYGGGLQVAMGADVRYIAPDAEMSVMEIAWGLVPDMSGTQTLRHVLRHDVLKELTLSGRIVEGAEAVELGLATHLSDDPFEDAMTLARQIAARSPTAVRAAKRLLNATALSSVEDGLRIEASTQASLIGGHNQIEAVMANLEKREPVFQDPE
jgi:enoyl-CoA hydratase/carnithine racemase